MESGCRGRLRSQLPGLVARGLAIIRLHYPALTPERAGFDVDRTYFDSPNEFDHVIFP